MATYVNCPVRKNYFDGYSTPKRFWSLMLSHTRVRNRKIKTTFNINTWNPIWLLVITIFRMIFIYFNSNKNSVREIAKLIGKLNIFVDNFASSRWIFQFLWWNFQFCLRNQVHWICKFWYTSKISPCW